MKYYSGNMRSTGRQSREILEDIGVRKNFINKILITWKKLQRINKWNLVNKFL